MLRASTEGWPRVTEILSDLGLINHRWSEPKHMRRGRAVDAACNILGAGRQIEEEWWRRRSGDPAFNDEICHEELRPFVEAYQRFLRESGFIMRVCALEVRNSAERYVGHIDQLGNFPVQRVRGDGDLIDIKTGTEASWHRLQLGLYAAALGNPRRWNLYLTDDGKYCLVQHKDPREMQQALALVRAWWVMRAYKEES